MTEGLPASRPGVKPGWIIEKIDGKPVERDPQGGGGRLCQVGDAGRAQDDGRRLAGSMAASGRSIGIDFLDGKDKPVHRDLTAKEPVGVPATFGHLPTFYVRFTTRRIEGSVGYVSLNVFFDAVNVMKQFGEAIEANRDADGLIIDLRGNPGGMGMMSFAIANWFVTKPGMKLGTLITRTGSVNFPLHPASAPLREAGRGAGGRAVDVDLRDPGRRPART